jgi:hypothetical protein
LSHTFGLVARKVVSGIDGEREGEEMDSEYGDVMFLGNICIQ